MTESSTQARKAQDTSPAKEANRLLKEASRLLGRNKRRISTDARQRLEDDLAELARALKEGAPEKQLKNKLTKAEATVDEVLGFAKKGAAREFFESIGFAVLVAFILRAFVLEAFKIPSGSMIPTLAVGDHIFVNKFIYGLRIPFTNAWIAQWGSPDRGDVIVFRYPLDQSKDYIKRVVALSGDRIRVQGQDVFVNGEKLPRERPKPVTYIEDVEPGSEDYFPNAVRHAYAFPERSMGEEPKSYTVLYNAERGPRMSFPNGVDHAGLECDYGEAGREPSCQIKDGYVFVMGDNRDNSSDSRTWGGVPFDLIKGKAMFIWWSRGAVSGVRWERIGSAIE